MKKTLLTLAVLGTFAGTASAQSTVTIYGIADMGFVHDDGSKAAGSINKLDSGVQSASRLGFKGVEDLGGGLSALFTLESGINVDDGGISTTSTAATQPHFGRQAFVGLQGGFGAVKLGRQYSPIYDATSTYDPFGTGLAGNYARIFDFAGSTSRRMDNAINYTTVNLGGFTGEVAYGLGEVAGDNSKSSQYGLNLGYANGPVSVKLAHQNVKDALAFATKSTAVGGSYDFGVAKLSAMYQVNKDDGAKDTRDWLIGASAPFGASTVLASYMRLVNKAVDSANSNQIAIGYTYSLSKRTNLYTSYSRLANGAAAKVQVDTAGATDKQFNAGIRHVF